MVYDGSPGEIIYQLRKSRNISQEELAGNICSTGTISRIENGSQIPTRRMFYRLIEQLGEAGFSYGDYYDGFSLEEMYLKNELLESMEFGLMDKYYELLFRFFTIYEKESHIEKQFYEFVKLMYWDYLYRGCLDLLTEAINIMRITHKDFTLDTDISGLTLNQTQVMIVNFIAIAMIDSEKSPMARKILRNLFSCIKHKRHILPLYWKNIATVINNIALCEIKQDRINLALELCDNAIFISAREGGSLFHMKLLRTRIVCNYYANNIAKIKRDIKQITQLYKDLPENIKKSYNIKSFLRQRKGLMIF